VKSRSYLYTEDAEEETVMADEIVRPHISLFDSFYLAFASFTQAEQFQPQSKSSKIFVASWSMLILIILATYTANLAAILTKSDSFVEEIQSMNDAVKLGAKTCVSTRNVYYPSLPTSYSNTDEISQLYPFVEVNGLWDDLYEYMKNGSCRVALFNREDITAALQNQDYCDLFMVSHDKSTSFIKSLIICYGLLCCSLKVGGLSDSDGNGFSDSEIYYFSTGLVVNFDKPDLLAGLNAAILYLLRSGIAQSLRSSWAGGVCTLDNEAEEEDALSIQLKQIIGPFVVHFSIASIIIVFAISKHTGNIYA
jgi:hypothetical protein